MAARVNSRFTRYGLHRRHDGLQKVRRNRSELRRLRLSLTQVSMPFPGETQD